MLIIKSLLNKNYLNLKRYFFYFLLFLSLEFYFNHKHYEKKQSIIIHTKKSNSFILACYISLLDDE